MSLSIESKIFSALTQNIEYARKVMPFLQKEYFSSNSEKIIFDEIQEFFTKYNSLPTKDALALKIAGNKNVGEKEFSGCDEVISSISEVTESVDWLVDETEQFCKDRALHNALRESILIADKDDRVLSKGSIPQLLQDALSVSFDQTVGHDYLDDADSRYDFYHMKEKRIPFDLSLMNKITDGGVPRKTLSVVISETGKGKSTFLCHHAAHCLTQNMNVLYITLEMAEERIAERIDANLMNVDLGELKKMGKKEYLARMNPIRSGTTGKLVIREYPTSAGHVGHFEALIQELKVKKDFVPDVIMVDYLNICASQRYKASSTVNSYTMVKAIAEELRGCAVKNNVAIYSATQFNRAAINNSNPDLSNVSESTGLSATVDFMFALVSIEELEAKQQVMIKQLKNRFGDLNYYNKFLVGINRARMRLYDLEEEAATENIQQAPAIDDDSPFAMPSKFSGNYNNIKV